MHTAAIYSRKSKFTKKGESIENQISLCKEYAKTKDIITPDDYIYEDEGLSGGNINRPDFQKMMKAARSKKFDVIICYRLDRISRNVGDFSNLITELQGLGIEFISIREQFDTSTPMGRAMMNIAAVFAQLERETIAERVRDNMLELAKTGRWLGGQTPLGFESEPIEYYDAEMEIKKMYKLSPVTEELDIVKLIFEKYSELKSISQVNKYLLTYRIKTKQGCDWSKKQIQQVLTNPVYVRANNNILEYLSDLGMNVVGEPDGKHGLLTYNKKQGQKIYKEINEWIVAVAKHEGIIDADEWLAVQDLLKENKERAPRLGTSNTALLTGLLRCKKCGSSMGLAYGKSHKKDSNQTYYYYTCRMKNNSGLTRCDNSNVRGDQIEEIVINELKEITADPVKLIRKVNMYKNEIAASINNDSEIENIKINLKENETSIQNLVRELGKNKESSAAKYIIAEIENLNKANEELQDRLDMMVSDKAEKDAAALNMDIILNSIKQFTELIDKCSVIEKRILIGSLVDTIYWDGSTGDIEIRLFGTGKKK